MNHECNMNVTLTSHECDINATSVNPRYSFIPLTRPFFFFSTRVSDAEDDPDRSLFGHMCGGPGHFPSGWALVGPEHDPGATSPTLRLRRPRIYSGPCLHSPVHTLGGAL